MNGWVRLIAPGRCAKMINDCENSIRRGFCTGYEGENGVDLAELEAYVMVCREGKMSRAAEKLFMSKQTLSMTIKRVEAEMEEELLERTGSGVEMTEAGRCVFDYAQQILALHKACGEALEAMRANSRVKLSVGFGLMVWNFWSKKMGAAFERQYPEIELSAEGGHSCDLLQRMDEGELDMVITCMQTERYAQYDSHLLRSMDIQVRMAQDDPLAQKEFLTPWDLEGRILTYSNSGADFLQRFSTFLEGLGVHAQSCVTQGGNFLWNLREIREEKALQLTNSFYNAIVPSIGGFVSLPLVCDERLDMPKISVYALTPQTPRRKDASAQFMAFLARQMQEADRL